MHSVSSPVQVPGTTWKTTPSYGNIGSANYAFSVVKTDGTLWVWGYNGLGTVGDGSKTHRSSPTQIPGTTWKSTFGGQFQMSAIKTDGTLWMWGQNNQGQLAQNNKTEYSSPRQVPGTTWKQLSLDENHTLAVKTDGTMWAWGENSFGEAGSGASSGSAVWGYQGRYSSPVLIGAGPTGSGLQDNFVLKGGINDWYVGAGWLRTSIT